MSKNVIEVRNLGKQYMKKKVVDNVSFEIKEGSIVGLIGPNGAGKTTIMKMIGGLVLPTGGEIEIFGAKDVKGLDQARKRISFIIETPYAKEDLSARENLEKQRLQKGFPDKKRVDEVLKLVGLQDAGNKPVKKFSLGMRQRLGIAIALLVKPEIMVLDEPINGLDPEGIIEIREMLLKLCHEEHVTIIISSHILSELSLLCTDYIFIHHGEVVEKISATDLENKCREYFRIHTSNDSRALTTLQNKMGIEKVEVAEDGSLRLYEGMERIYDISKGLFEEDIVPLEMGMKEVNLEQYYINLVGTPDKEEKEENGKKGKGLFRS